MGDDHCLGTFPLMVIVIRKPASAFSLPEVVAPL
jgi:hypothetical protein